MKLQAMKNAPYFIAFSVVFILAGLIVGILMGMNIGIDFTGGTILNMDIGQPFDNAEIEKIVASHVSIDFQVASSNNKAIVRMQDRDIDSQELDQIRADIVDDITALYPDASIESIDRVGAIAGKELINNAFMSVAVACMFMLVYIWIRFELVSGFAALVALLHDVAIMVAAVAIFRLQINSSFIAAILTIVGYSINDTIVVFDRIRDNQHRFYRSMNRDEIVNKSVQETIVRSLNTSLTTLFTITAVYILGVTSIREFTLPLIVGIVSGTYSSIFIASPFWVYCYRFIEKKRAQRAESHKKSPKKA